MLGTTPLPFSLSPGFVICYEAKMVLLKRILISRIKQISASLHLSAERYWNLDLFWVYDPYLYFWMEPGFILGLWPVSLFLDGTWIYFGSMARIFIFGWNLDLFWV